MGEVEGEGIGSEGEVCFNVFGDERPCLRTSVVTRRFMTSVLRTTCVSE